MISDHSLVSKIQRQCKDSILSEPRLRRVNIVNEIVLCAENYLSSNGFGVAVDQGRVKPVFDRYRADMVGTEHLFWSARRYLSKVRASVVKIGGSKFRDILNSQLFHSFLP